jgi:hypothetical protein
MLDTCFSALGKPCDSGRLLAGIPVFCLRRPNCPRNFATTPWKAAGKPEKTRFPLAFSENFPAVFPGVFQPFSGPGKILYIVVSDTALGQHQAPLYLA